MSVVILQRCVPHYRAELFRALHRRFGWRVVAAENFPAGTHLALVDGQAEFLERVPFRFADPRRPSVCRVPVERILQRLRPAAVIAELSVGMSSSYELPWRRRTDGGPPVVFWSHGYNMDRGFGPKDLPSQLARIALGLLADAHVVYSDEGRRFLRRFVAEPRIAVVRNSLALPFAPAAGVERPPDRGRPELLFVGRLTGEKNVPALIRILKRLLPRHPRARLTVVGDGPERQAVRDEAGDLLGRSVRMAGALYDEPALARHFRAADLAVFPGAVGLSVNHALLHGLPVAAFARSPRGPRHHPEIAYVVDGVTGMLVRPASERAMADALLALLERHDDPRGAFREPIARFVERNLTLERMLEDFERVRGMLHALGAADA